MTASSSKTIGVMALLLACGPAPAAGQLAVPPIDSLVATFVDRGALAQWRPHELFDGCPRLDARQRRGITLLMSASLSAERIGDLANSWSGPLGRCADPQLDRWYFDLYSGIVKDGKNANALLMVHMVLGKTPTPSVQAFLRSVMLDPTMPERERAWAGGNYIEQMHGGDLRAAWRVVYESETVPWDVLRYATWRLLIEEGQWLVPEVVRRIRLDPDAPASYRMTVVMTVLKWEGQDPQREAIARAIEEAAVRGQPDRREVMHATAEWMRRGKPDLGDLLRRKDQ